MGKINQITHPDKVVERKVNYFGDYFHYVVHNIGKHDALEIENPRSLIEKSIFQIENNLDNCPLYLVSYFSHKQLGSSNQYLEQYKQLPTVQLLIAEFKGIGNWRKQVEWISKNPQFLCSLKAFRRELSRGMFKSSLNEIISFLKCPCPLETHREEIKYHTHILVSEFLLKDGDSKEVGTVFNRIMSRESRVFPFPNSLLSNYEGDSLEQAKERYINERTFDQQFEGISNIFKQKTRRGYFLFRVRGIESERNFRFNYNKVTFYNPNHKKFDLIKKKCKSLLFLEDFFDGNQVLIAAVKVEYYGSDIAEQEALITIKSELEFISYASGANAYIEDASFLSTSDFKNVRGRDRTVGAKQRIDNQAKDNLNDNPFKFLKDCDAIGRHHLLEFESLFIKALRNHSIVDYWHYLETIIPNKFKSSGDAIVQTISLILILHSEKKRNIQLENYLLTAMHPINTSAEALGMTKERQFELYQQSQSMDGFDLEQLLKEISNPILVELLRLGSKPLEKKQLKTYMEYYSGILLELKAQRNAILHSGKSNEIAMIQLKKTLPDLIKEFRWLIFETMKERNELTFEEILSNLKSKAEKMLD